MITLSRFRAAAPTGSLLTLLACAGRGQTSTVEPPPPPPAAAPRPASSARDDARPPSWLLVDSAASTATLTLEVTAPAGVSSALINGYRAGEARIIVPRGWTVKWIWRNGDPVSAHSLVVMVQREKIPLEGGRAAFSNARTRMVTEGLAPGQTDQTTFVAEEAGWYWLLCGVPNHALNGEWLELRVDLDAKVPSVVVQKK